ncbi:MAG: hypothetical protein GY775_20090 [Candidatus Scalindua sp.]|nr:hypothetical protein [Candidatus Scalindua sp.]
MDTDNKYMLRSFNVDSTYWYYKEFSHVIRKNINMDNEAYLALIKTVTERIEYLEHNDPGNPNLDELKLLLSDNVSKDGKIQVRFSLLNKKAHYHFSNYTDYLHRYEKEHLCN